MVTKNRKKIDRSKDGSITPEVVAAWHAADRRALHSALGLKLWQDSPLPLELHGIDPDMTPRHKEDRQSLRLQQKLLKLLGWPNDCRHVFEADLKEAEREREYCLARIRHPDDGDVGTGSDPISRRHKLEEAEEDVAYFKQVLAELDSAPVA